MNVVFARERPLSEPPLKAAVIYDDFDFAARSAALLERAGIRSDDAIQWDVKPWRLDLLRPSSLAEVALAETADTDLVVVALSKTHLLPETLLDWLGRWAEGRQVRDAALLVLCPEETAGPQSSSGRLQEFAAWHGLMFLEQRHGSDDGDSLGLLHQLSRRKRPVNPAISWLPDEPEPTRHWGINE